MAGASAVFEMSILLNGIRAAFPPRLKAAWQPHMIPILHQYALTPKTGYLTTLDAENLLQN